MPLAPAPNEPAWVPFVQRAGQLERDAGVQDADGHRRAAAGRCLARHPRVLPNIASSVFSLLSSVSCLRPHLGIMTAFALISHRRH